MSLWCRTRSLLKVISFVLFVPAVLAGCPGTSTLKGQFQQEIDSLHARYQFPGATAAYVLPDGVVEVFAVGLSDVELESPMTTDSRMLAASIGKTFVAATILALAQEGSLCLDDSVSKWLGERSWYTRLPNHEPVTIRQLLNHSSGIPNHVEDQEFAKSLRESQNVSSNPLPPVALIEFVLDKPPLFRPGEGWHYTDTGYLLLGLIIEIATGRDFYAEVRSRFLEPLGLSLTTPSDRIELPGLASGYMAEENPLGLPTKTTIRPGVMAWHPGVEWAGGGFVSNPRDLAVWGRALFEGQAIEGDYLDDLFECVQVDEGDSSLRYGAAVAVREGGPYGPVYGHGGWIPGYTSSLRYYAQYDFCVAFQINTDVGIVDDSSHVVEDMEQRLAEVLVSAVRHSRQQ